MTNVWHLLSRAIVIFLMTSFSVFLNAQLPNHLREYPLADRKASGDLIAPIFNGWTPNADGSVTMLFGFASRNREEIVDITLGPNNYIEPAQFDGAQPTHFPVYNRGGFIGINERGAFAVTVPADMAGTEVVWTIKNAGYEYSVPGRATSTTYEMSDGERALGTLAPAIRFERDGPESTTREGIRAARVTTLVGNPVTLAAYIQDRGNRAEYPEQSKLLFYPLTTDWVMHQGPVAPDFERSLVLDTDREAEGATQLGAEDWVHVETRATFSEPGSYIIRLRVSNFAAPDSRFDNMCCWSNAYVPVTVTQ